MKKLYLDVDGVVLTKQGAPAQHLVDFLKFATSNFDCCWLTTHCDGNAQTVINNLSGVVPDEAIPFLKKLKPTSWKLWKTEAIDFTQDFLWFDDYAFDSEKIILEKNNASKKLITIDLKANPNQLLDIIKEFEWTKQSE